jgi:hypothetical protein
VITVKLLVLAFFALVSPPPPRVVTVGVYVSSIYGIDLKNGTFTVDFYLWFRWRGDDLKPLDSFEVVDGRVLSKSGIQRKRLGDESYANCRVTATITRPWDVRRFPIDDHVLRIEIEDSDEEAHAVVYRADAANQGINPELQVPGWKLGAHDGGVTLHSYHTNYGDTSLPVDNESTYARYVYSIAVARPGYGRFLKIFFGLFIAVLISWCAFFVRPKESSPRVSLGIGATFAAAAVTLTVNNALPDSNAITLADEVMMLTLGSIVASVAVTITSLALFAHGHEKAQKRVDRVASIVFPVGYVLALWWIIAHGRGA